jgi:hypothetical protein
MKEKEITTIVHFKSSLKWKSNEKVLDIITLNDRLGSIYTVHRPF